MESGDATAKKVFSQLCPVINFVAQARDCHRPHWHRDVSMSGTLSGPVAKCRRPGRLKCGHDLLPVVRVERYHLARRAQRSRVRSSTSNVQRQRAKPRTARERYELWSPLLFLLWHFGSPTEVPEVPTEVPRFEAHEYDASSARSRVREHRAQSHKRSQAQM